VSGGGVVATTTTAARTRASKRRGLGELAQQPALGLGEQGQLPAHGLGELRDWASGGGPRASEQRHASIYVLHFLYYKSYQRERQG
jgi:hypothetical protein